MLGLVVPAFNSVAFPISIVLSALALFGLGAAKVFVTELRVVGGLAVGVAYVVGLLSGDFGV